MSQFARRVYYISAFLIFAVVAPLLLAWTSGYRWENVRRGFISTGAIVVYSSPKASLYLNNQLRGTTPLRLTHVAPGSYTLELRKDGYGAWTRALRVAPNAAQVIGPVLLLPESFTDSPVNTRPNSTVLASLDQQTVFGITTEDTGPTAQSLWPADAWHSQTLSSIPTRVSISPDKQSAAWQNTEQTLISHVKSPSTDWDIGPVSSLSWDSSSTSIVYGIQHDQAKRFDGITRQITDLGPASSLSVVGNKLWLTIVRSSTTDILRMNTFGQQQPTLITALEGQWKMVTGATDAAIITNTDTREMIELSLDPLTDQVQSLSFGPVDSLWWSNHNQAPLWLNGSDLLTFDEQHRPVVLDRLSRTPSLVRWIENGHIIAIGDAQSFSISSVSTRQGRGVILAKTFASPSVTLAINVDKKTAVVQTSSQPLVLEELHW